MNDYSGANLGGDFAMNMRYVAVLSYLEAQNTSLLLLDENGVIKELFSSPVYPHSITALHKVVYLPQSNRPI